MIGKLGSDMEPMGLTDKEILEAFPEAASSLVPEQIDLREQERADALKDLEEARNRCKSYDKDTGAVCVVVWEYFNKKRVAEIDKHLFRLRGLKRLMECKDSPGTITKQMIEKARKFPIETLEGLELKRAGKLFKGRCPFHSEGKEKTPSFVVYPDGRGFHCFGCGKNGDSIDFIRSKQGLSFTEAVRFLVRE